MAKVVSAALAGVIGVALAVGAAYGVAVSQTKAPNTNPVSHQIIDYGNN